MRNSINHGFEVTDEDMKIILEAHKIEFYEGIADKLNANAIEQSAMYGDDVDEQTKYAYQEIENQLKQMGVISKDVPNKF